MRIDTVYNRTNVTSAKGHMARRAEGLLAMYLGCTEVAIVRRIGRGRVQPGPTQIVYVASTGGKWAKSAEVRLGVEVQSRSLEIEHIVGNARNLGGAIESIAAVMLLGDLARQLGDDDAITVAHDRLMDAGLDEIDAMRLVAVVARLVTVWAGEPAGRVA